jgi:3-oxoacyl-[acyl-carrier protein] reductase
MMDAIEANVAPDDPAAARRRYTATIPMGRYGRPEEVADATAWLLADAPRYLTGQTLVLDGGLLVA